MPGPLFSNTADQPSKAQVHTFERDFADALALDGGEIGADQFTGFLRKYFDEETVLSLLDMVRQDIAYFREEDPASALYDDAQILSVRRGMAAIAGHRIFHEVLRRFPQLLYNIEVIAKYVQKDTNVEIHPNAQIAVPFGIDHGHGTVIGATARVGSRVFIYHGVTLGATGRRSRSQRRHPIVGDRVFFGNGSQVLGPSIIENDVMLASGVIIKECYVGAGVRISTNVHISGVIVPAYCRVFAPSPEDHHTYWATQAGEHAPKWARFDAFNFAEHD